LATVNVFKNVGEAFKDIFFVTLNLAKSVGPLQQITEVLNYPIVLPELKAINRQRRRITKEQRNPDNLKRLRQSTKQRYGTDGIPIIIRDLCFGYPGVDEIVFTNVNISVAQGKFVVILGDRRSGKRTIVRLLGQVFLPDSGSIFIPSYLRVLHVQGDPQILNCSMWRNLCVGRMYWTDTDVEIDRALTICRRIGLSSSSLKLLESTQESFREETDIDEQSDWEKKLTKTDRILIHIARAIIYNPEVLVMNQPTRALNPVAGSTVMTLLREFCDNRGVGLPSDSVAKRRPRTVFISSVRHVDFADVVWKVGEGTAVEISQEEAIQSY